MSKKILIPVLVGIAAIVGVVLFFVLGSSSDSYYNIQIMEEHQTILGIGGAATSKVVNFREKRLKSSFNAKDLITYLRDIDIYIDKRAKLIAEAYGGPQ